MQTKQIQAVLITDSFENAFRPITIQMPKALLPVANIPMIQYSLSWILSQNLISEVFIIATVHIQKIKSYINKNWSQHTSSKSKLKPIHFKSFTDCKSIGDIMRNIDQQRFIQDDFILIRADVITNIKLDAGIFDHRIRRADPKNYCVLTKFFRQLPLNSGLRSNRNELFTVINPDENQILKYQLSDYQKKKKFKNIHSQTQFDLKTEQPFRKNSSIHVEACLDFIDCHIDICTPELIKIFSDNYDFKSLDNRLINNTLSNDVSQDRFFYYDVPISEYVGFINNPKTYGMVATGVIERKAYPLVLNKLASKTIASNHLNFYQEDKIIKSQKSKIGYNCVIGGKSVIGDDTILTRTCIGKNCKIGNGTKIKNSFIWNNVEIGQNCSIQNSIIADNVVVGNNCIIRSSSMISYNVIVKDNVELAQNSIVSLICFINGGYNMIRDDIDDEVMKQQLQQDKKMFKKGTICRLAKRDVILKSQMLKIQEEEANGYESEKNDKNGVKGQTQWDLDLFQNSQSQQDEQTKNQNFLSQIYQTMERGHVKKHSFNEIKLEINSLKLSEHKENTDCIMGFMPFILKLIEEGKLDTKARIKKMQEVFKMYKELLVEFLKQKEHFFAFIDATLKFCSIYKNLEGYFHLIIQTLSLDITNAGDQFILQWYDMDVKETDDSYVTIEIRNKFKEKLNKFVQEYLRQDQDDDDEDDDQQQQEEDNKAE